MRTQLKQFEEKRETLRPLEEFLTFLNKRLSAEEVLFHVQSLGDESLPWQVRFVLPSFCAFLSTFMLSSELLSLLYIFGWHSIRHVSNIHAATQII